ncbi:BREX system P-loop protein BrxC [Pueribacillus theae]|uniref:BREX system P-loop protein BrxC n=1 Tax=Pueribacillus theae TaxID=2171751 RepID=A0A2U1JYF5_9BACI|nr:BREX system P-loop protein BrxC [Pueribacillus theae]PWA10015.1 BREX system P-loop protein BrxC [Pueribacillus theae]
MQIRKMFRKRIDRDIPGVVKIGNEGEDIHQELDEYVVTNEIERHMKSFFSAYKKGITGSTDAIGVWISGFFGSGKSHFLKILSYLAKNDIIQGKRAIDYFEDKIQDHTILEDMKRAGEVSKDIILFDIDAKSESDAKHDKNAIVKVMNKAFNEMQGFCGAIPWIADMERLMVENGEYEAFKEIFKDISGKEWVDSREDFYYEEDAIIEALVKTTRMSEEAARNWFERAEQDYTLSIERFADRVRGYIESKGDNHHVLFFIDEIGQYIGEDSRLMLNLQTIVHELGLKCKGKAWVIVTSQEDYDSYMSVKGNDFSKIQGRFDTKLSLSSAFVDEVITKRLLLKNEHAKDELSLLYDKEISSLNNMVSFPDNMAEMKKYSSKQEFIDVYPFIPYQFHLLQRAITEIAHHSSSTKHQSRGERSLLSAFREAAIQYADEKTGSLIPFSAFYGPMIAFLDTSINMVIIRASQNSRLTAYDIEILKLLFLIKYLKEMPATIENIATLMVKHVNDDKLEMKKEIESSLARLLKETLIQKNGEEYDFLTNDEQDVNREIQNMPIDSADVIQKIGEEIFGGIYTERKYRHSPHHHFEFNALIDDRPIGSQAYDIGLRIVTPDYEAAHDIHSSELKAMSMRENNVIVHMPPQTTYLDEMVEVLKIQAYLLRKSGTTLSQTIEDIRTKKAREVDERKERVSTYLKEALQAADIYVNGGQLDVKAKKPLERINEGFKALIHSLYHKLDYISEPTDLKQLQELITQPSDQLSFEGSENQLALNELNSYIDRLSKRNQPPTVKGITAHFKKQPYGWNELDTTALIVKLLKMQEIKLLMNSAYIQPTDKDLFQYVTKRDYIDRVTVQKRERISPILMKNIIDLSREVFGITALPHDEDNLMSRFKELIDREQKKIETLLENYKHHSYPGKDVLEEGQQIFEQLLSIQDTATFYKKARDYRRDLKDYASESQQVKDFFKSQRDIYDKAVKKLTIFESNRTYVHDEQLLDTVSQMEKIVKHATPYSNIQELPALYQTFDDRFIDLLSEECEPVKEKIEEDQQTVMDELNRHPEVKEIFTAHVLDQFMSLKDRLDRVNNFYEALAMEVESDRLKVRLIQDIQRKLIDLHEKKKAVVPDKGVTGPSKPLKPMKRTKTLSKAQIMRGTTRIESREDIDHFLNELRVKLESELDEDTVITLV